MISTPLPPPGPRFLLPLLRRIAFVVVIGLALRLLAGCAALPTEGPVAASVVLLKFGVRNCGGVATGPRTIMTAAHCVDDLPLGAFAEAQQEIVTSDDWVAHGVRSVHGKARVLSRDDGLDVAVLGLAGSAPDLPVWVDMRPAGLFPRFTVVRARDGFWKWNKTESGSIGLFSFWTCAGDSGSGVFDSDGALIGVMSTRFALPSEPCGQGGTWRPLGVDWGP